MSKGLKTTMTLLLAAGVLFAVVALLGFIPFEQNRVAQRGYEETRAIATSADIEIELDQATSQPIGMSAYQRSTSRQGKPILIATGFYHPETLALQVLFEANRPGSNRPRATTMSTKEFALEVERLARAAIPDDDAGR